MNRRADALNSPGKKNVVTDTAQETCDDNREIRLQVFLARCGVASRRAGEKIILSGRVEVNGVTVSEMGYKVSPADKVYLDGKLLRLENKKRYVLLNKPVGYVSTLSDEKGRPSAASLLADAYPERLYNVGRLDMYSQGAIIFTNDGDFALKTGHPSSGIEKEYIVETSLPFNEEVIKAFTSGIRIDNVFYKAVSAEKLSPRKIKLVLAEGKNREIRRVLGFFDIHIKKLVRVRIGSVRLGDLPPGGFRDLTAAEINSLLGKGKIRGKHENHCGN